MATPKGNKLGKGRKKGGRKFSGALYNPNKMLSGKPLANFARATTRIELLPGIRERQGQLADSRKAQARDVQALSKMGERLRGESMGVAQKLEGYGAQNLALQQGVTSQAQARLSANAQASTDRLNQLQSSVLGEQMSALAAQKITPGGSAGDQAMARLASQQQASNEDAAQSWQGMSGAAGANAERQSINMASAQQNEAQNQQLAMARNIASRMADTRAAGAEERRGLRRELGTIRATKGATFLKNLMAARREQQQFGSERAQTLAALQQNKAQNAIDWYEAQTGRLDQQADARDGGSSGGSSDNDKLKLDKQEWRIAKTAAEQYRQGDKITDWQGFMDKVESQPGVSFNAVERKKFLKRYRKWLAKQG